MPYARAWRGDTDCSHIRFVHGIVPDGNSGLHWNINNPQTQSLMIWSTMPCNIAHINLSIRSLSPLVLIPAATGWQAGHTLDKTSDHHTVWRSHTNYDNFTQICHKIKWWRDQILYAKGQWSTSVSRCTNTFLAVVKHLSSGGTIVNNLCTDSSLDFIFCDRFLTTELCRHQVMRNSRYYIRWFNVLKDDLY